MLFQIHINLTEEDYVAFNHFHSFDSIHGKKMIRKTRITFIAVMALLMALVVFVLGWTTFSITYATVLGLFIVLYMLLFKKLVKRNIKVQIKRLKKIGKLPFDPESTIELWEDKIVEITPSKRTEQSYNIFERICIVEDRYIYLYYSSVGAYILPMAQVKAQANQADLLSFLSGKCKTMEYY